MLDEMFQRNAPKFAVFYIGIQKTQICFFRFSFRASMYFVFSPNECPVLCRHRPGHSLWGKTKYIARNEKRKKQL